MVHGPGRMIPTTACPPEGRTFTRTAARSTALQLATFLSLETPAAAMKSRFDTTHWSLVAAAAAGDATHARQALADLCERYWYPLYAFVRRQGHSPDAAEDLTQAFFVQLLERRDIGRVDRSRGRFRSYLLASVKHFLINDALRQRAAKRGGGQPVLALEFEDAERRYAREPADERTPETAFDRQWALAMLGRALSSLRQEMTAAGRLTEFECLKPSLTGGDERGDYEAWGRTLGLSAGAVKVAVHRLRRRFQRRLREEIADTVASEDAVDAELQYLAAALKSRPGPG